MSASVVAALRPFARPPTKASAPISGLLISASPERGADAGQQRDGQPGPLHDRVREGQGVEAALRRRLGHHAVAGEALHQLGVDLHHIG